MKDVAFDPAQAAAYTFQDQRRMSRAKNYFAWQGRLVTREIGRRVIEVGCGVGNFTGMLLDREAVMAVDKESRSIERLKQRYPGRSNLRAVPCDANDDRFSAFAAFAADSCVCLNVLEHLEDDVGALRRMSAVLVSPGTIVLLVPAFPALFGLIDINLGHYRRYTRRRLRQLAARSGLHLKKVHYVNAIGFFGWWANSRIFKRQAQSARQIGIFDRYLVPLVWRVEALAPPPFGQSLFAVLQKP